MDGEGLPSHGGSFQDACSGPSPVFGHFPVGVGRKPPRSVSVRVVVSAGEFSAHKSPGDEGPVPGPAVLPGDGHRSPCDRDVRQFDSGCLHQQARRGGVRLPLLVDQATSPMDRELRCPVGDEVSAGAVQCSGRSPQPSGAGYRVRVVSPSPGGESTSSCLRFSVAVLLPSPGSLGHLRGCVPTSVGRAGRVRFSSLSPGLEGRGSSQRDPKSLHDSGRPSLAGEGVVCGPPPSADPTTSDATPVGPAASAAPLQPLPPGRPRAEPSRVATLKRLLRKSGFLRGAALEMSGCVRESTARLYQAKWLSFCGWCRRRGIAPVNATVPLIVDFFIHLRSCAETRACPSRRSRSIGLP